MKIILSIEIHELISVSYSVSLLFTFKSNFFRLLPCFIELPKEIFYDSFYHWMKSAKCNFSFFKRYIFIIESSSIFYIWIIHTVR